MFLVPPAVYAQAADTTSSSQEAVLAVLERCKPGAADGRPAQVQHSWELERQEYQDDKEQSSLETVLEFVSGLAKDSRDLDPEIARAIDENFWDMV